MRRYSSAPSTVSSGVFSSRRNPGDAARPIPVSSTPNAAIAVTAFPMAWFRFSFCPAPYTWPMTTAAPAVMATKKPTSTLIICAELPPTAASAFVPTNRPTISPSTALYSCWMMVPAAMGMKKTTSFFHTLPAVRLLFSSFLICLQTSAPKTLPQPLPVF